MTYASKMSMKEYKESFPELAEETKFIIWAHKPILETLEKQAKQVEERYKKREETRVSSQERIDIASDPFREVTEGNQVRVLDGKPLNKATKAQRKAFLIQEESKLFFFPFGEDLEEQANKVQEHSDYVDKLPKCLGVFSLDRYDKDRKYRKKWNKKLGWDKIKLYYKRSE